MSSSLRRALRPRAQGRVAQSSRFLINPFGGHRGFLGVPEIPKSRKPSGFGTVFSYCSPAFHTQCVHSRMLIPVPTVFLTASRIFLKNGQGNSMGFPLLMQEAKAITSAPRSTMSFARGTALLPGHPPQETNPTISTAPVF